MKAEGGLPSLYLITIPHAASPTPSTRPINWASEWKLLISKDLLYFIYSFIFTSKARKKKNLLAFRAFKEKRASQNVPKQDNFSQAGRITLYFFYFSFYVNESQSSINYSYWKWHAYNAELINSREEREPFHQYIHSPCYFTTLLFGFIFPKVECQYSAHGIYIWNSCGLSTVMQLQYVREYERPRSVTTVGVVGGASNSPPPSPFPLSFPHRFLLLPKSSPLHAAVRRRK